MVYTPVTVDTTLTLMVHVPLAAIVALFKVSDVSPLAAAPPPGPVTEAEPPQEVNNTDGGLAMTMLAGKLSVSEVCVSDAFESVLRTVMVSWLVCPTQIVLGENVLLNVGGWMALTCNVALAGVVLVTLTVPVGSVDFNVLVGMVLT